ncbi:MAG: TerD family protein [Bradymonadia bacterium]
MGVSLSKGQKVSLTKSDGGGLKRIAVGLGWGKKKAMFGLFKADVDLDASALLYSGGGEPVDAVWFGSLRSRDGSIVHTGDDRAGGGSEQDPNEVINVDLTAVPREISSIVFVVNSYSGESFKGVPFAFCNVVDGATSKESARYNLNTDGGDYRGFIIAKVIRTGGGWSFEAIGEPCTGRQRTIEDIEPQARRFA